MITYIGLSVIVIAWIYQLFVSFKNSKVLSLNFLAIYSIGVLLLVIDSFNSNLVVLATINLVSLLVALSVFVVNKIKS